MKKIIFSLFAVAALAACSKSEVAYDQPDAIGFQVVTGKMTKAAVADNKYPENLNMYVFAMTEVDTTPEGQAEKTYAPNTTADYLKNAEFKQVTTSSDNKNLWGGWLNDEAYPYYWPNVKKLYFAGVSKSGNVTNATGATAGVPVYNNGTITIEGYQPGVGTTALGNNDLMWFPTTLRSYGKGTEYVPVVMKHACSWITIKLVGDGFTAENYVVTDVHIEGLTTKGKAELGSTAVWTLPTTGDFVGKDYTVYSDENGTELPKDPAVFENNNSTIVLPNQVPGTLSITYHFTSQAETEIEEVVTGSLKFDGDNVWQPGVHYTYNVSITASQIYIQPDVQDWTPSPENGGHTVTVQ